MSAIPKELYYSHTHEWVRLENDGTATIGITDHAQNAMGDMVFVELPEKGATVTVNGQCGVLESVKSASDFYSPIAGKVIAVNEKLVDSPELVNKDPYGDGWIVSLQPQDSGAVKQLMDAAAYAKYLEEAE
jgi:glycine cleavage system H protein